MAELEPAILPAQLADGFWCPECARSSDVVDSTDPYALIFECAGGHRFSIEPPVESSESAKAARADLPPLDGKTPEAVARFWLTSPEARSVLNGQLAQMLRAVVDDRTAIGPLKFRYCPVCGESLPEVQRGDDRFLSCRNHHAWNRCRLRASSVAPRGESPYLVWAEYERDALIRLIAWWCIDPPAPLRSNLPDSVSQALRCSQFATGGTPEVVFVYELAVHEAWVRLGGAGNVDFAAFVAAYDDFYDRFALDGHEPDGLDQALLRDHAATIDIHRRIRDEVLYLVCRAEDAEREAFRAAGRIGPDQAVRRLATFAKLLLAQRGAGGV